MYRALLVDKFLNNCSPYKMGKYMLYDLMYAGRVFVFIVLVFASLATYYNILRGKRGKAPKLRRLPGMDAIDEAIGRATEMGRPIHFTTGYGGGGLDTPKGAAHLAGLSVLNYVADTAIKLGSPLIVSVCWPEEIPIIDEQMRILHMKYGRGEEYIPERVIRFFSNLSMPYAAGVMDTLVEENVAANFMIGWFWGETLLMAETGAKIGAIQIAGAPDTTSIPFFIASCDYVLISEEVFCAGAYASRDPMLHGSLVGEDWLKLFVMAVIAVGVVLATLGAKHIIDALVRL
jgi:hypothetical protein